jgi:hypothetical protein
MASLLGFEGRDFMGFMCYLMKNIRARGMAVKREGFHDMT